MGRANIKVMHGRGGVVRIQEDLGDSIKIYSLDEWNAELDKRAGKKPEAKPKDKGNVVPKGIVGKAKATKTVGGAKAKAKPKAKGK